MYSRHFKSRHRPSVAISNKMKPPWGINGSGGDNQPRFVVVAVFSFIACLGAFLMGFNIGYGTQTLDELNSTVGSDSISSFDKVEVSLFNVSHLNVSQWLCYGFIYASPGHFPSWGPGWRSLRWLGLGHFRP